MSFDNIKRENRHEGNFVYRVTDKVKKNYTHKKMAAFTVIAILVQLLSPFRIQASIAPTDPITSTSPAVDTFNVTSGPTATYSTITFSKTPLQSTVNATNIAIKRYSNDVTVTSSVQLNGNSVQINHSALAANTAYYFYVSPNLTFTDNSKFPAGWSGAVAEKFKHAYTTSPEAIFSNGTTFSKPFQTAGVTVGSTSSSISFNRNVLSSTINTTHIALKKYSDGTTVSTAVSVDGSDAKKVNITHSALAADTAYYLYVRSRLGGYATGVQYADGMDFDKGWGTAKSEAYLHSFTTNTVAFTGSVVSSDPAIGAYGVQVGKTSSSVTFSKSLMSASINKDTINIRKHSDDTVVGTQVATIDPNNAAKVNITHGALQTNTKYYIYIRNTLTGTYTTGLQFKDGLDFAGGWYIANKDSHAFTTTPLDITSPTATMNPVNGSTNVPQNFMPVITFSEAVSGANATNITLKNYADDTAVALDATAGVTYTAASKTAVIKPASNLAAGQYYLTVSASVVDGSNNAFVAWDASTKSSHQFTVAATTDNISPTIFSTAPAVNEASVDITTAPTVTFDKAMNPETVVTHVFIKKYADDVDVAATPEYDEDSKSVTITPDTELAANTKYYYFLDNNVKDTSGNSLVAWDTSNKASHSFTTGADSVTPRVLSTDPTADDTEIGININPSITFSKAMNAGTVTNVNIKLMTVTGNTAVTSTVTYDTSSHIAVIKPATELAKSTEYYYFISNSVTDSVGNPIALWDSSNADAHTFTTGDGSTTNLVLAVQKGDTDTGQGGVVSSPSGINVTNSPDDVAGSGEFAVGQKITLTATAATGSKFSGWENCTTLTANQCTITLSTSTGDQDVVAHFTSTTPVHDLPSIDKPVEKGAVQVTMKNAMPKGSTYLDLTVQVSDNTDLPIPEGREFMALYSITAKNQSNVNVTTLSPGIAHVVISQAVTDDSYVLYWDGKNWTAAGVTNVQVDIDNGTISFDTTHFSEFAVFTGGGPRNGIEAGLLPEAGANLINFFMNLLIAVGLYSLLSVSVKKTARKTIR